MSRKTKHSCIIRISRAPQAWLSQFGHVSALQEDGIGDAMYTRTEAMVHEMGLSRLWPAAGRWQFCAGGLQGFVRGRCVCSVTLLTKPLCAANA